MTFLARCQLEGVDEAGMKEREVELEMRRVRRKEREDMYRCQNPEIWKLWSPKLFRERNSREKGYSTGYIKLPCDRLTCEV